ncbi:MAG TPA: hypothetical protein VFR85_11985 [Anaeromyxobacteraceae bacterium]|nr:hypothetical protein [Anaeromyxobacteraceae bacterium]
MSVAIRQLLAGLGFACALLGAGPARAWNIGTHLYVVEKILAPQVSSPSLLMEAAYGSTALDLFNNDFTSPGVDLQRWLHDPSGDLFMEVWREGATASPAHRAFAFGLVSHNNAWGADATAHNSGLTSGQGVGWVIERGQILGALLDPVLQDNGIVLSPQQLTDVGHVLVEQAVDLLMLQVDPALGGKLMAAAAARSPSDPARLGVAWSHPFAEILGSNAAGVQMIRAYEAASRDGVLAYGWALSQPNPLPLLAGQIAVIAEGYLGLPPGAGAALTPLIEQGILAGMQLSAGFQQEVDATATWVGANMAAHGVAF